MSLHSERLACDACGLDHIRPAAGGLPAGWRIWESLICASGGPDPAVIAWTVPVILCPRCRDVATALLAGRVTDVMAEALHLGHLGNEVDDHDA